MKKGEIFTATNKKNNPHPIIFLEQIDNTSFKACIISHRQINNNVLMSQDHFHIYDENNLKYPIQFENTCLVVDTTFIKMDFWLTDLKPKGRLTDEGINFVEEHIYKGDAILCPASISEYSKNTSTFKKQR